MRHNGRTTRFCGILALCWTTAGYADEVVVRPPAAPGPLDNPLKGWCPYVDAGRIRQPYSMVFLYVPWRQLEPEPNQYRFAEWEKTWDTGAAKGRHIVFRVFVDYPSRPPGLPDWLKNAGVKQTPYDDHGGGLSPDYDDPKMVAAMERFIAALGERFNGHPRVAFVQLGMLGFWGEWHTWPKEAMYASPATERRVIDAYRKAFPDKQLMARYARDHAGEQPWLGFHDDMFPEDTDNGRDWSFLAGLRRSGRVENWKRGVVGGEMVPGKAKRWLGDDFETTQAMLEAAHFTWVGPYCPPLDRSRDERFLQRSRELVRRMGYEFRLTELRHPDAARAGQPVTLSLRGENLGVAPFYYPWPAELALLDGDNKAVSVVKTGWDIREWLPGRFAEAAEVSFDVPAGEYRLAFGIRDPWKDRPGIGFANRLERVGGWAVVSELRISPKR